MPYSCLSPRAGAQNELNQADYELLDMMIDAIEADIESWFSSSIACCDACFDKYAARWPRAYTADDGLQYQGLDQKSFYSTSRHVRETVTESEFDRFLPYIACPNCSRPLGPNLFAFELPFYAEEFETDLKRLADLATVARFLVLSDEFAQRMKNEISRLCSLTELLLQGGLFFRGSALLRGGLLRGNVRALFRDSGG